MCTDDRQLFSFLCIANDENIVTYPLYLLTDERRIIERLRAL